MEENQNVNANPQKKKMGKAKKIVIAIIVLLVIAIAAVAVLGFTGVLNFNFTKKSKADAGLGKVSEVFNNVATELETEYNEAGLKAKVLEQEKIDNCETSFKMSANINKLEIADMSSDDEEIINAVKDILNQVEVGMTVKSDDEQVDAKLEMSIAEEPVSVEVAINEEKVGVRSEELNAKWLTIDLQEIMDSMSGDIEFDEETIAELEEVLTNIEALAQEFILTDEEVEHFKSTYTNILKDYILSLDIESEKDKIEVGDKEKNCTKTTITLGEDEIKELLIAYVEKAEKDDEGKKIVKEKINLLFDFIIENGEVFETSLESYDDYLYDYDDYNYDYDDYNYDYDYEYDYDYDYDYDYEYEDISIVEQIKEMQESLDDVFTSENFDMIKDAIEEIDLEGLEITIESYSSLTKVYATDITIDIDGSELAISMVFDDNTTNATIGMSSYGMSMDIAEITLVNEKNHKSFGIKAAKDIVEYMGSELSLKGDIKISENKMVTAIAITVGEEGSVEFTQETNVKTNTDTEYSSTNKTDVKVNITDVVNLDVTLNCDYTFKTANIDFTSIDEYIDVTKGLLEGQPDDATMKELQQYVLDAVPGVVKVLEALKEIEIVEEELSTEIDNAIVMLEDLSMEDFNGTELAPSETLPELQVGTGSVEY